MFINSCTQFQNIILTFTWRDIQVADFVCISCNTVQRCQMWPTGNYEPMSLAPHSFLITILNHAMPLLPFHVEHSTHSSGPHTSFNFIVRH